MKSVTIQLSGNIKAIACQSAANKPFLAVAEKDGNPYLTSIEASEYLDHLTVIGDYAFQNCTALERATGFVNVVSIGQYAFQNCTSLTDLGSADKGFKNATSIGTGAFAGCSSLQNLVAFPSALKLGVRAFADCLSLAETTGLGDNYRGVPYYTVYNPNIAIGADVSGQTEWYDPSKQTYTIDEMTTVSVNVVGWKTIRKIATDDNGVIIDITWGDNINLPVSFGSYAFENCTFSSINMESYEIPPSIQGTTFTVDPSKTLVYVPAATEFVDPIKKYQEAPGWMPFFDNIIAASSLEMEFYPSRIHGNNHTATPDETHAGQYDDATGVAIFGMGTVTFTNSIFTIDWGDGSATQEVSGTETTYTTSTGETIYAAAFPSHIYPASFQPSSTYSVSIRLRGSITSIKGVEQPDGTYKPLFAVAPVTKHYVKDVDGNWSLTGATIEDSELQYDALRSVIIGGDSKIDEIGDGCFYGFTDPDKVLGSTGNGFGLKNVVFKDSSGVSVSSLKKIGNKAFYNCSALDSFKKNLGMVRNDSSIGNFAFYGCSNLHESLDVGALDFIEGCSAIGIGAFQNCTGLSKIVLPSSVNSVAASAFEGCYNVVGIEWAEGGDSSANGSIGARAFCGCSGTNSLDWNITIPSQIKTINEGAFFGCGMKTFTWGDESNTIAGTFEDGSIGIFESCTNVETINIYSTVSSVPRRTFCQCKRLTTLNFAERITSIGAYAFFGCESINGTFFENICRYVTSPLGDYSFARCMNIGSITIPSTITALGEGCFSRSALEFYNGALWKDANGSTAAETDIIPIYYSLNDFETEMTAAYGTKRMDVWGIYDTIMKNDESSAINLLSVTWNSSVNGSIGAGCFMNCKGLQIDWANFPSVRTIPSYCFYNCNSLFYGENLSSLPSTITYFGKFSLARTGLTGIGRFTGNYNETTGVPIINAPLSANLAPALFLGCRNLTSLGGNLYNQGSGNTGTAYPDGIVNLFATAPSEIPPACFYGCSSLANINILSTIPSITRLEQYSFAYDSSLKSIGSTAITSATINIREIGDGCFMRCTGLSQFYGMSNVTHYPYNSFAGCTGLSYIERFSSDSNANIMLEGDSFGGIEYLSDIDLSFYRSVVTIRSATGEDDDGQFISNDPFSGITNKKQCFVNVTSDMLQTYSEDPYWNQFSLHVGQLENQTLRMSVAIPSDGLTLYYFGSVILSHEDSQAIISWGDGTTSSLEAGLSHTYGDEFKNQTVEILIGGDIETIQGVIRREGGDQSNYYTYLASPFLSATNNLEANSNSAITSVTIIKPLTIGIGCFANCTRLSEFTFTGSTARSIKEAAFYGCSSLKTINGNLESLQSLDINAFGYSGIASLDFMSTATNITAIPVQCFARSKVVNLVGLPANIKSIGARAFSTCTSLESLEGFENLTRVTSLGTGTFVACNNLSTIRFPPNLTALGPYCFRNCYAIGDASFDSADWPSSLTAISNRCFSFANKSSNLRTLEWMPSFVTDLGEGAFYNATLTSLNGLSPNISSLPNNCFGSCTLLTDLSGLRNNGATSSITSIGTACFSGCTSLTNIRDLSYCQLDSLPNECFKGCTALTSIEGIPDSCTTLGSSCFQGCSRVTSLQKTSPVVTNLIPANVYSLGASCFAQTGLGDLDGLPSGLTTIGERCFENCASLVELSGIENTSLTVIPEYCFSGCSALQYIVAFGSGDHIPLQSAILRLENYAFRGCTNIKFIKLGRFVEGDSNPITYLGDSNEDPTVFPYEVLRGNPEFKIYVPEGSFDLYNTWWCSSNLFYVEGGTVLETYTPAP